MLQVTVKINVPCNVCKEDFAPDGDKVPRLLNCGHTLCHFCLQKLDVNYQQQILCPFDREPTQLKRNIGVQGLKKNFTLLDLLALNEGHQLQPTAQQLSSSRSDLNPPENVAEQTMRNRQSYLCMMTVLLWQFCTAWVDHFRSCFVLLRDRNERQQLREVFQAFFYVLDMVFENFLLLLPYRQRGGVVVLGLRMFVVLVLVYHVSPLLTFLFGLVIYIRKLPDTVQLIVFVFILPDIIMFMIGYPCNMLQL